jgi:hypothetical protein
MRRVSLVMLILATVLLGGCGYNRLPLSGGRATA